MKIKLNKSPALAAEPAPSHGAFRQADPWAYQAAHRRLAWILRLSVGTNVVLAASLIASIGAFSALLPLKEIRPAFITLAGAEDQIVRIEPIEKTAPGFELLLESMARRYVRLLLEIDSATQKSRFDEAFAMTSAELYKKFSDERFKEIERLVNDGYQREVRVESASKVDERSGVWTYAVDFVQVDSRKGEPLSTKPLRAYLTMITAPQRVNAADKYINPLGVIVTDIALKEK